MSEAPTRIWLQRHDNPNDDFSWTWCRDRINDDDVGYVRAEIVGPEIRYCRECWSLDGWDAQAGFCYDCGSKEPPANGRICPMEATDG